MDPYNVQFNIEKCFTVQKMIPYSPFKLLSLAAYDFRHLLFSLSFFLKKSFMSLLIGQWSFLAIFHELILYRIALLFKSRKMLVSTKCFGTKSIRTESMSLHTYIVFTCDILNQYKALTSHLKKKKNLFIIFKLWKLS